MRFSDFRGGVNLPITKKFIITKEGTTDLLNIDVSGDVIKSRRGWATFKTMVKELDRLNKDYKKQKIVGNFTIKLPIRGSI